MWTYILRRLLVMIPTLFGVTVVSFLIMQLAPGDPLKDQLGASGLAGQSGQNREAYLIQKRDLKLDKPLVLNFNYFRDYGDEIRICAHYLGRDVPQIAAELGELAKRPDEAEHAARLAFLRALEIEEFDKRLADPAQHESLATAVQGFVGIYCDDVGLHGVPAAMAILGGEPPSSGSPAAEAPGAPETAPVSLAERIGAIRALRHMVPDPLVYVYSREPSAEDTPQIVAVWERWWEGAQETDRKRVAEGKPREYPPLSAQRRQALEERFEEILHASSRAEMFAKLEYFDPQRFQPYQQADMRFFVEKLLGDTTLPEKVVAAAALGGYVGQPLAMDVPVDATPEEVQRVAGNWKLHYRFHRAQYEPGLLARTWYILGDTQYAHMVWRLITFDFGRSATRTREPVADKILAAVLVSAPIMFFAELVIYFVAVPLGILCAVTRGGWTDRLTSLGLFVLYSVPPFVAAMLFLLFFCYGDYLRLFPMDGLHSDWAEEYGFVAYTLDYLWHITLPVICLSLFSLAGLAMYSRTSMLDVVGQDYIRTARAKGLSESKVILKHGLRNALIPVLTLFANFLPAMLGGSVLIEVLFGIPGMGRLSWESIEQKDFPTLMALIYIDAIVVMLSILATDILYVFVDPRISFEGQGRSA